MFLRKNNLKFRRRRKITIILTISTLILITILKPRFWYLDNLRHPIDYLFWGLDYKKMHAMESIEVGMSEIIVKSVLGEPDEISYDPFITQHHGKYSEYGKKIPNPNKCYWYSTGIDIIACIVFDEDNKVVYVSVGGT